MTNPSVVFGGASELEPLLTPRDATSCVIRYQSPSGLTCIYLYGTNSTYAGRTYASLCFPLLFLVLSVVYLCESVFIGVFWLLDFFVISPIWSAVRIPITMLCPLYYDNHIRGTCWDTTFNC
jgi:hypothetical protein